MIIIAMMTVLSWYEDVVNDDNNGDEVYDDCDDVYDDYDDNGDDDKDNDKDNCRFFSTIIVIIIIIDVMIISDMLLHHHTCICCSCSWDTIYYLDAFIIGWSRCSLFCMSLWEMGCSRTSHSEWS